MNFSEKVKNEQINKINKLKNCQPNVVIIRKNMPVLMKDFKKSKQNMIILKLKKNN